MLLIYSPESSWTDDERQGCMIDSLKVCDELAAQGKFFTAGPLQNVPTASCVRSRNGRTHVTTGPFAETVEQLGGYFILNLENLDEAIAVASRLPPAKKGTVEIRPIMPLEGLPETRLDLIDSHDESLTPFMLLCYDDEEYWKSVGSDVQLAAMQQAAKNTHQLAAKGQYISASPLHPTSTATSLRVRNGQKLISDGPFAETREVLGGYYLILAKDQQEAEAFAANHPGIHVGAIEIRPLFDLSGVRDFIAVSNSTSN
jgi:hypothetical protein